MGKSIRKKQIRHGMSNTRIHNIWHSMYCRCYYPSTNQYKHYGGKGIKVCEEWKHAEGFINFYNWAINNGYNDKLTLDRIDNEKDYCPENCKWSTSKQQSNHKTNNRIIEYNGIKHTLTEWCDIYKINITTLSDRLRAGLSINEALNKPVIKSGGKLLFTINNETKLLSEWCKIYNINYQTAWKKIKDGKSIEKALKLNKC